MARTESKPPAGASRVRYLTAFAMLAMVVSAAYSMRDYVERRLAFAAAGWQFSNESLPAWMSVRAREDCARQIAEIPARVSLGSAFWREDLRAELEALSWIESVTSISRSGETITFNARFLRPVVAVRTAGGYLLVDSSGRVIDHAHGEYLSRDWGVPGYEPSAGPAPLIAPGELCEDEELSELLEILGPLAEAGAFEAWPGAIREAAADLGRERDRFWILRLAHGTPVEWGRAPSSALPQSVAASAKQRGLLEVLSVWRELEGAARVELWVDERPMVAAQ
ncbi:MAG: hypothetical protein L0Z55_03915 [Planctomycetes bacterium]|nr:hypothetical protein [Planctomycetota bacterium]